MANERLLRLKTGAIDETRELFGIFIYLWVLLSLFSLHRALVLGLPLSMHWPWQRSCWSQSFFMSETI
jgi:hypothetical protein